MPNKKARRKDRERAARDGYAVEYVPGGADGFELVEPYPPDGEACLTSDPRGTPPPAPPGPPSAVESARLAPGCVVA